MSAQVPKKVAKPFSPAPRQKWFTFFCEECEIYFKIDCHDTQSKRLQNACCPLCKAKATRKGGIE